VVGELLEVPARATAGVLKSAVPTAAAASLVFIASSPSGCASSFGRLQFYAAVGEARAKRR
jgi:hypothetical protein